MTWYPLWSYHFQNYESLPAVSAGITQFIRFSAAVDGNQIRLVFSNENGKYPVVFRNGSVACDDRKTSITWENDSEILLHPGEIKATDAIKISIKKGKQRFTRGYKRYKETSDLTEWKIGHIFHSIFT